MADFRRWFYALALVAMLAGLTIPVSAQAPPFQCIANAGVPPIVRGEGYTELVGDLTLNCTGGTPTPFGKVVPQVNFTILLNTNITSRLLSGGLYNEALLIIDEPHSGVNPNRNILNCGASGASDGGPSGPTVCSILSTGDPSLTYDGTQNGYGGNGTGVAGSATTLPVCSGGDSGTPNAGSYGCGRPNVFQGRTGTQQNPGQFNSVTWLGVPVDPPGTTTSRTIRFTNIRADAVFLGVSSTFTTNFVQAQISVNGNTSLSINNPQQIVAFVQKGLITSATKTNFGFLQCNDENKAAFAAGSFSGALSNTGGTPTFQFQEGFASSWKAKNIAMIINTAAGATGNGQLLSGSSYWSWSGSTNYPTDVNQNVPGAIYNTESGFEYSSTLSDPTPNPPQGTGTIPVSATANPLSNGTGISGAGRADQGTRLALQISSIPSGSVVLVPTQVNLCNTTSGSCSGAPGNSGGPTGTMVLTSTDANGAGAYSAPTTIGTTSYVQIPSSGLIVYEILFADPFSVEVANVPLVVAFAANLAQNLPQPGVTAQVAGSFAPFYSTAAAHNPSSTLPIPRFVPGLVPTNLFSISKCACNILFPYVAASGGYDTGIAIANTSLDPGGAILGGGSTFGASPQAGTVEFWYYGTGANNAAPPGTQCTNTTTPGTCPGTTTVPAGQVLTYVLSSGSTQWGLDNRANGFVGYIIAQAQFQYCHAFAFIGALGAGPLSPGISQGYLGLILDNKSFNSCTNASAGAIAGQGAGLCRTNQAAENLVQ